MTPTQTPNPIPRRAVRRGGSFSRVRCAAAALSAVSVASLAGAATAGASSSPHSAIVPLVLYSAQGYDSAMSTAFTKATGIPVHLDDNSTGPLLTQIEAEKNNPKWNLLWVDGTTAFAGLDTQGLLLRDVAPSASVKFNSLGTASLPADKSYVPTGVTMMAALLYNNAKVPTPPATWSALTSQTWKGQIGMNDPTQSGPTYPFIAGMMNSLGSMKAGETFYSDLKSNGLVINPTNGPTIGALTSGRINIALVQSSAATGAVLSGTNLAIKYLNPVTTLPSAIGVDAKASKQVQKEAKLFINFVLSPAGQHVMQSGDPTGDSLYYPVVKGTSPLPALPSLAGVKTQTIDPYQWGPLETKINTWFEANIVQ